MAASINRVLTQRGRSSVAVEREHFEKVQASSLQKALSSIEAPLKEKHARTAILGTHNDRSSVVFWNVVTRLPLQGNQIVCWKFCHVLHKLLRDGYPTVLQESVKYATMLHETGRLWNHLRDGYGRLIAIYMKLLRQKLSFHSKNPRFPGNLVLEKESLDDICGADINNYFVLSVDLLDYMDDVLTLQSNVFNSLSSSRTSSMTAEGQCRLAPLVPCILDSCQLYDYVVKILFRLHSSLPPDTLSGHRTRFTQQFTGLKQFYGKVANMQYFRHLIRVPTLPENPPNFLRAAELSSHVKPMAVVPEPEPEPEHEVEDESNEIVIDTLVDTSTPPEEKHNGDQFLSELEERDLMIAHLQEELNRLKNQLDRLRQDYDVMMDSQQSRIRELEMELREATMISVQTTEENEALKTAVGELKKSTEASARLAAVEKLQQTTDEKFKKLKEVYTKLQQEHVVLLKTNADLKKQYGAEVHAKEELVKKMEVVNNSLQTMSADQSKVEDELRDAKLRMEAELRATLIQKEAEYTADKAQLEEKLKRYEEHEMRLAAEKEKLEHELTQKLSDVEKTLHEDKVRLEVELKEEKARSENATRTFRQQEEVLKREMATKEAELKQAMASMEAQLKQDKASMESSLRAEIARLKDLVDKNEQVAAQKLQVAEVTRQREHKEHRQHVLASVAEQAQNTIRASLTQAENPTHSTVTCPAEYLIDQAQPVLPALETLEACTASYIQNANNSSLSSLVTAVQNVSHNLGDAIVLGFATAHVANIEPGQVLADYCKTVGDEAIILLELLKTDPVGDTRMHNTRVVEGVKRILRQAELLLPKLSDVTAEEIGDLVDKEMQMTTDAIESAAAKIAEMLLNSREKQTGLRLEVNEKILDSCNQLMLAIKILIEKSKALQREITSQGKGALSTKEFYKKNHRWTEGLISAAKAVGWGANVLVETGDRVIRGDGKFEELMVCAQEIAASTTQLVVASKVKADQKSEKLSQLSDASKKVTEATGSVVASSKTAAQMIDDIDTMDFSKLTLHQAKRLEMDAQVKVLELESKVEKERKRLAELRKKHYQLGGESEGWEQEDIEGADMARESSNVQISEF